jgi:hypothetical protein
LIEIYIYITSQFILVTLTSNNTNKEVNVTG